MRRIGQQVNAGRCVESAAPGVGTPFQVGGLDQLDHVVRAGDTMGPTRVDLNDVDSVRFNERFIGFNAPFVFAGSDRRADGGSQPRMSG